MKKRASSDGLEKNKTKGIILFILVLIHASILSLFIILKNGNRLNEGRSINWFVCISFVVSAISIVICYDLTEKKIWCEPKKIKLLNKAVYVWDAICVLLTGVMILRVGYHALGVWVYLNLSPLLRSNYVQKYNIVLDLALIIIIIITSLIARRRIKSKVIKYCLRCALAPLGIVFNIIAFYKLLSLFLPVGM